MMIANAPAYSLPHTSHRVFMCETTAPRSTRRGLASVVGGLVLVLSGAGPDDVFSTGIMHLSGRAQQQVPCHEVTRAAASEGTPGTLPDGGTCNPFATIFLPPLGGRWSTRPCSATSTPPRGAQGHR